MSLTHILIQYCSFDACYDESISQEALYEREIAAALPSLLHGTPAFRSELRCHVWLRALVLSRWLLTMRRD